MARVECLIKYLYLVKWLDCNAEILYLLDRLFDKYPFRNYIAIVPSFYSDLQYLKWKQRERLCGVHNAWKY